MVNKNGINRQSTNLKKILLKETVWVYKNNDIIFIKVITEGHDVRSVVCVQFFDTVF